MNPDGASVVVVGPTGTPVIRAQVLLLKNLVSLIAGTNGSTFLVHLRASTTSVRGLPGCHMFDTPSGDWIYSHNGVIFDGMRYRVDSMIVGDVIDGVGPDELTTLPWSFANVVAIHNSGEIRVHHSFAGKIHSDWKGNWATCAITDDYTEVFRIGWHNREGTYLGNSRDYGITRYTQPAHGEVYKGSRKLVDELGQPMVYDEWVDRWVPESELTWQPTSRRCKYCNGTCTGDGDGCMMCEECLTYES